MGCPLSEVPDKSFQPQLVTTGVLPALNFVEFKFGIRYVIKLDYSRPEAIPPTILELDGFLRIPIGIFWTFWSQGLVDLFH